MNSDRERQQAIAELEEAVLQQQEFMKVLWAMSKASGASLAGSPIESHVGRLAERVATALASLKRIK